MKIYVYALVDPRSGEARYVGASKNVRARFIHHLLDGRVNWRGYSPKNAWLRAMRLSGTKPKVVVLEEATSANAESREWAWIVLLLSKGHRLTNYGNLPRHRYKLLLKDGMMKAPEAK